MRKRSLFRSLIPLLLPPAVLPAGAFSGESIGPSVAVRSVETIRAPDGMSVADLVTFDGGLSPRLLALAPEESLRVSARPVAPGVEKDVVLARRDFVRPPACLDSFVSGGTIAVIALTEKRHGLRLSAREEREP
jgi:hypothetical protein